MDCMLLDDEGKEVTPGEPGEIYVRGPNVCVGYWKNEGATKESLSAEGWLKTGDVAIVDKQGRFWIVDRKKVRPSYQVASANHANTITGIDQGERAPGGACRT